VLGFEGKQGIGCGTISPDKIQRETGNYLEKLVRNREPKGVSSDSFTREKFSKGMKENDSKSHRAVCQIKVTEIRPTPLRRKGKVEQENVGFGKHAIGKRKIQQDKENLRVRNWDTLRERGGEAALVFSEKKADKEPRPNSWEEKRNKNVVGAQKPAETARQSDSGWG